LMKTGRCARAGMTASVSTTATVANAVKLLLGKSVSPSGVLPCRRFGRPAATVSSGVAGNSARRLTPCQTRDVCKIQAWLDSQSRVIATR
jgi:hypothetical protein